MLEINLLGVPEVVLDGHPVTFARRGSIALLAYLALSRRAHARETLATLLAGDSFEEQARKYLSNVLVDLRQQLGPYIVATRQSVAFDRSRPYRLDVAEFQSRVATCENDALLDQLDGAIDLYRGEFLAGLALAGTPDFDSWQLVEREELRGQYMQLLHSRVDISVREGAWSSGIQAARRIIAEEPWLEEAHRQLILMLARSGQRNAAIAQYQACRRVLREELGVDPSVETTALFNRLRAAVTPPTHNVPIPPSPLVGRLDQVRALTTLLADPDCRLVTITGLAGSGKSRVALEVARGFAAPNTPPPEQPFPDGVFLIDLEKTRGVGSSAANPVQTLLTALDSVLGTSSSRATDLLQRITTELSQRALLLVLDNIDRADVLAGVLSELLAQAPYVKVLVTARLPLHLPSERVLHVDGLRLPAGEYEVEKAEASLLFLQEARRTSVDFALSDAERGSLVALCRMLGGFPLALVLAARWAPILPCSVLVSEVESGLGLDVLATADADLPERHRSITRILENALAQLPADERSLAQLLRLATDGRQVERGDESAVPRDLVRQLRALDEQALLRVDRARGTVELHPLLRSYARRKHQAEPSPVPAAPVPVLAA